MYLNHYSFYQLINIIGQLSSDTEDDLGRSDGDPKFPDSDLSEVIISLLQGYCSSLKKRETY